MKLHNHIEEEVFKMVRELLRKKPDICHCEQCQLDIAAIALNHLKPKYVVSAKGEIFSKIDEMDIQFSADLIKEITHAIDIVAQKPHHQSK